MITPVLAQHHEPIDFDRYRRRHRRHLPLFGIDRHLPVAGAGISLRHLDGQYHRVIFARPVDRSLDRAAHQFCP